MSLTRGGFTRAAVRQAMNFMAMGNSRNAGRVLRAGRTLARMTGPVAATAATAAAANSVAAKVVKKLSLPASKKGGPKTRRVAGSSRGGAAGTLSKFKRRPNRKLNLEAQYARSGYVLKRETSGSVSGSDLVFVSHSSYVMDDLTTCIWGAVVRKLFLKAGILIDSTSAILTAGDNLNPLAPNNNNWRIVFVRLEKDKSANPPIGASVYTLSAGETLRSAAHGLLSGFTSMYGINGANAQNAASEPIGIYLYTNDAGGTSKCVSSLNLANERMEIYGKSSLKIQNRTTNTVGGETEVVTAMPMIGKRYYFKSGVPHAKLQEIQPLCQMSMEDGCLAGADSNIRPTAGVGAIREPVVRTSFTNCYADNGVKLEPGEIKSGDVFHTWKGTIYQFYKTFRRDVSQDLVGDPAIFKSAIYYHPGKAEMYMFEDALNLSGDANINVVFECQKEMGCRLKTSTKRSMLSDFQQTLNFSFPFNPVPAP